VGEGKGEGAIRKQVAECVSLVAELDFPEKWPGLIDVCSLTWV